MRVKLKHCDGPCQKDKPIWKNEGGKRYCSDCYRKIKQAEPTNNARPRTSKPIKQFSDKRQKEEVAYKAMRIVFLTQNPFCFMKIPGRCTTKATTIQHKKGRGKYFLDTTTWGSACMECHAYCDTHPEEAFENGWAEPRLTDKK
jgi:hypothetical protein